MPERRSPIAREESPRGRVERAFFERFHVEPQYIVRAPGRVNLMGEHTDYNDGFVLPLALERAVWIALRAREDGEVRVRSLEFAQGAVFDVERLERGGEEDWAEYLKGTAWALREGGRELVGWEGVMASDVPMGAGLSSSAALELATARAFAAVAGFEWQPAVIARLAQRAENEWVGMNCGIMDQLISAVGVAGHAVLIDCRSLQATPVPLPRDTAVVVLDTATRRGLVGSAYNERRRQCEDAARFFRVDALRDVGLEQLAGLERAGGVGSAGRLGVDMATLDETTFRRARHVSTENARTVAAADAMRSRDARALGELMNASHASMRDDFEISSDALDAMVDAARAQPGCLGARMTGGGFGGCCVALVERTSLDAFASGIVVDYEARTGREPKVYVTRGADGASVVD